MSGTPPNDDAALGGIVEAEDQPRQGGLAGAGAPQQPQHPARLELKVDLFQNRFAFFIGEVNILEGQRQRIRRDIRARDRL